MNTHPAEIYPHALSARRSRLAIALAPLLLAATAVAQPQLEEVLVTAERRSQSIQDVPLSVAAISGDNIEVGKVQTLNDIAFRTPGLTFNQFNVGEPRIYIRGIGNSSDSAASDPAVGVFLDEVYIGRTGGVGFDLFDIERIEILRGPQGTLYGRNTNGGAINIVTAKPSLEESTMRLRASAGNYDLRHIQGLANGALTDSIAGKVVFSYRDRDGFGRNVITPGEISTAGNLSASELIGDTIGATNGGRRLDDAEAFSVRSQLLFAVSERAELLLGADYSRDKTNGACRHLGNLDLAIQGLGPFWALGQSEEYRSSRRNCASQFDTSQERTVKGLMAKLDVDLEWGTLTSISAWRASDYDLVDDLTGIPLNNLSAPTPPGVPLPPGSFTPPGNVIDAAAEDASQISQEIRLAGTTGALSWIVGGFYMEEDVERDEEFYTQYNTLLQGLGLAGVGNVIFSQDNTTKSTALFGQLDWELNEQLTLTYGVRWSRDKKNIVQDARNLLGTIPSGVPLILPPFPAPVRASDSWSELTHKLSAAYRPIDGLMLYATYSEGFKSGAFQSQTNLPSAASQPVDPELVTSIEVGMKSTVWNNRAQFNLSYYDMDYEDLQIFELNSRFLLTLLNAEARSRGVEASLDLIPFENASFTASYNWNDATFDEFINSNGLDLAGNDLPFAPRHSLTLAAGYSVPMADGSVLEFGASYNWKDRYFFGPQNRIQERQSSVAIIDANVGWTSADQSWQVDFWGKNLGDKLILANVVVDPTAVRSELYFPPRTYGLTVTKSF